MKKLFCFKTVIALALALTTLMGVSLTWAEPWKFGVMADTQWTSSPDNKNPNDVAVNVIDHLNKEFIKHKVKFVIQTGDLTEDGNILEIDTTATFRQALYNAGIGFYPLRGNHEGSAAITAEFKRVFPQTGAVSLNAGVNNQTPSNALVATTFYGDPTDPLNPFGLYNTNSTFIVGSNFSSPTTVDPNYAGLTYSFDYGNARFVLLDGFGIPGIACNLIENQQPWISSTLSTRPADTHAFVFSHKGLITENHTDILFTAPGKCDGSSTNSNPSVKPNAQNDFISSLFGSGVRYYINGHDHMHNRAIVKSPNDLSPSTVQNIATSSNSYKFYTPLAPLSNDEIYNIPAHGITNGPREMEIAQELYTVGYYIVTVDGPRVTVDFYSSPNGCNCGTDQTNDIIPYTFTKRETFGYSLNGQEFLVGQGQSYTVVQDSFGDTTARILDGVNGSKVTVHDGRATTKAVDTGWAPAESGLASDILTLWGMADLGSEETDTYVLLMSFDKNAPRQHLGNGGFGIATRDADGNWVNAVDMNFGGTTNFVKGPWKPGYDLGTYGVDASTKTAWAVMNHNGDFAIATGIEPVPGHRK
jgi:hypothetical protein